MKIKFKKIGYTLILVIVLMSFLKPSGFDLMGYNIVNFLFNIIRIISAIIIFIKYFAFKKSISYFFISEFIFFVLWICAYLIHSHPIMNILIFCISIMALTLLIEYCNAIGNIEILLNAFSINYILLLAFNLYYIVTNYGWKLGIDNGIYEYFSFLSSDNGTAGYIFPALYISMIEIDCVGDRKKKSNWAKFLCLFCVIILNELRMWSATTLVGTFLLVVYLVFIRNNKSISIKYILYGSIILNIGITIFRIQNLFSYFIEHFLNKTLTFTGRTVIWDWALRRFWNNPLIGNGMDGIGSARYIDNLIVQLLYRGGIILFFAFVIYFFMALRKGKLLKPNKINSVRIRDTLFFLAIIFIMSIAESWNSFMGFYIILNFATVMGKMGGDVKNGVS